MDKLVLEPSYLRRLASSFKVTTQVSILTTQLPTSSTKAAGM